MEKIKQYKLIILLIIVILGFVFYWFEWQPTQIRKECAEKHKDNTNDIFYLNCIRQRGLKE